MNNTFANGIYFNDGNVNAPSISFIKEKNTGIYKTQEGGIATTVNGLTTIKTGIATTEVLNNLRIKKGAFDKAILMSDNVGNAQWKTSPTLSSSFKVNELYQKLDFVSSENNDYDILFSDQFENKPSIILTEEADSPIKNMKWYIKNKTTGGFTAYCDKYIFKHLVEGDIEGYSVIRLGNKNIGVFYYDLQADRILYMYSSDSDGTAFSEPIIVDDISSIAGYLDSAIIDGKPALVYIADNGNNDEVRYILSEDANGSSWGTAVTIFTSSLDLNFISMSLFLKVIDNKPAVFLNTDNGRAQVIKSTDDIGTTWSSPINISNLTNHQIIAVEIINDHPAICARSNNYNNLYYVRSNDMHGQSWPVGATQLYKSPLLPDDPVVSMFTNPGQRSCILANIHGTVRIIASEFETNNIYMTSLQGDSWEGFKKITDCNTNSPFLKLIINNSRTYMLYNNYIGVPSVKYLVEFVPGSDSELNFEISKDFIKNLVNVSDHQVINNIDDNTNFALIASQNKLSLLRFFGNDYEINWLAHLL